MFTGQISFKVGSISWELEESTLKSLQSIEALKVQYCADGIGLTQAQVQWDGNPPDAVRLAPCFTHGFPVNFAKDKVDGETFRLVIDGHIVELVCKVALQTIPVASSEAVFTSGRGSTSTRIDSTIQLEPIPEEDEAQSQLPSTTLRTQFRSRGGRFGGKI